MELGPMNTNKDLVCTIFMICETTTLASPTGKSIILMKLHEAAWLYSPLKRIFIGYNNPTTIWPKCSFVVSRPWNWWSHDLGPFNR